MMGIGIGRILNGDCIPFLEAMSGVQCIIADPPDNLGLSYGSYNDNRSDTEYQAFLTRLMTVAAPKANHFWLSYYWKYDLKVSTAAYLLVHHKGYDWKKYIWRYTFGQHRESDCGSGFRFILRLSQPGRSLNTSEIRVASDRQKIYHDARANPAGRIPDDVWEFPRVTGNSHERRSWHPTQHPEGVYQRIIRMSTNPGDTVVDCFAGTGTLFRANHGLKLKRFPIGIDIDPGYCQKIAAEHNLKVEKL